MGLRDVLSASIIQEVSATAAHVMLLGERRREKGKREREGGEEGEIDTKMWQIFSL